MGSQDHICADDIKAKAKVIRGRRSNGRGRNMRVVGSEEIQWKYIIHVGKNILGTLNIRIVFLMIQGLYTVVWIELYSSFIYSHFTTGTGAVTSPGL